MDSKENRRELCNLKSFVAVAFVADGFPEKELQASEDADDDVLQPVEQHHILQRPFLDDGLANGEEVDEEYQQQ